MLNVTCEILRQEWNLHFDWPKVIDQSGELLGVKVPFHFPKILTSRIKNSQHFNYSALQYKMAGKLKWLSRACLTPGNYFYTKRSVLSAIAILFIKQFYIHCNAQQKQSFAMTTMWYKQWVFLIIYNKCNISAKLHS